MTKNTINYFGQVCRFTQEFNDCGEAQTMINYWQDKGFYACCTHENNRQQLYVSVEKRNT